VLQRPAMQAVEHVVLFDTSASQVGEHRQYGLSLLESFLKSLPGDDRVTVMAIDVQAVPMTSGGVSPADALASGVAALKLRFPAGSTNMAAGLNAALEHLTAGTPASVLYIGD